MLPDCTCGGRFPSRTGHSPLCPRYEHAAGAVDRIERDERLAVEHAEIEHRQEIADVARDEGMKGPAVTANYVERERNARLRRTAGG